MHMFLVSLSAVMLLILAGSTEGKCPKFEQDDVPHASFKYEPSAISSSVPEGTVATVTCHQDRRPGVSIVTCQNGQWQGKIWQCPKKQDNDQGTTAGATTAAPTTGAATTAAPTTGAATTAALPTTVPTAAPPATTAPTTAAATTSGSRPPRRCPKFTQDDIPHASWEYTPETSLATVKDGTVAVIRCHKDRRPGISTVTCVNGEWQGKIWQCPKRQDETTMEPTTVAQTTAASTSAAQTTVAGTTIAQTTTAGTSAAQTTVAGTTIAQTTTAGTSAAQTTEAGTTVAQTTAAGTTTAPSTAAPTTTVPPTTTTDINECSSNPCVYGSCTNGVNQYTCACDAGYSGTQCTLEINECASSPCVYGSCIDGVNMYSCDCDPGYIGRQCEFVDPCTSSPCFVNALGGICISTENGTYTCDCTGTGYIGANCQTPVLTQICPLLGGVYSPTTNTCFATVNAKPDWNTAMATCPIATNGVFPGVQGRLVQTKTQATFEVAKSACPSVAICWIALKTPTTDSPNVKEWFWYDDATTPTDCFSTTYWPPLAVTLNARDQDCGIMASGLDVIDDAPCSLSNLISPLCEFSTDPFPTAAPFNPNSCPDSTSCLEFQPLGARGNVPTNEALTYSAGTENHRPNGSTLAIDNIAPGFSDTYIFYLDDTPDGISGPNVVTLTCLNGLWTYNGRPVTEAGK